MDMPNPFLRKEGWGPAAGVVKQDPANRHLKALRARRHIHSEGQWEGDAREVFVP
jgi:hypothetical protein